MRIYWVIDCNEETVAACTTEEEAEEKVVACDGYWTIEE